MRMNRLTDAGLPRRLRTGPENANSCDGAICVPAWKEPVGGPLPAPVRSEHVAERLRQHHLPILVAFTAANPDGVSFSVQVGYLQAGHFRYAESSPVHSGQNGPVLEVLRRFQQRFDLGLAQNDGQLFLVAGHAEQVKVAHPLMLRAIAAAKKKNDRIDAS